jgi:KipI family sensor histidine kinase inhibitor
VSDWPRVLPVGDAALTVELGGEIDPEVNARVRALDRALRERPFPGYLECVPTYRSLLVLYDKRLASFSDLRATLLARLVTAEAAPAAVGTTHVVPTVYDGPDLEAVACAARLGREALIALHASREYTAFMLGFAPGFAYLGALDERLATERLATPRVRVPAGAVAIAGRQTAIYPGGTAGGWNLIGRTSLRLFDPESDPPALLAPGDLVRFEPVSELEAPRRAISDSRMPGAASHVEVVHGGFLTCVQDRGRRGLRRYGVGGAGAVDARAFDAGNAALDNAPDAAGLECTIAGPSLRFLQPVRFAISGGDLGALLERSDLGAWPVPHATPVLARRGSVLSFRGRGAGCRAYVAFAGGIDVPEVLGSRSTDLTGGFGGLEGRPLRAGDALTLLAPSAATAGSGASACEPASQLATLRVVLGPQDDHFSAAALERLLTGEFAVLPGSDRVACRLSGPRLAASGPPEIVSDGMVPGCIQVPPDGQPIVMLADSPTTGGYPKIATVITADLWRIAQLVPGEGRVRFARS